MASLDEKLRVMKEAMLSSRAAWVKKSHVERKLWMPDVGPVKTATDCSGLDAPLFGLISLGLDAVHLWSSDISPDARKWICAQDTAAQVYEDVLRRDHKTLVEEEEVDSYIAGFPCQPFSKQRGGRRPGFQDPRAAVFRSVLETVMASRPATVILENVAGVLDFQVELVQGLFLGFFQCWRKLSEY